MKASLTVNIWIFAQFAALIAGALEVSGKPEKPGPTVFLCGLSCRTMRCIFTANRSLVVIIQHLNLAVHR